MPFVILQSEAYLRSVCVLREKIKEVLVGEFILFVFIQVHKEGPDDIVDRDVLDIFKLNATHEISKDPLDWLHTLLKEDSIHHLDSNCAVRLSRFIGFAVGDGLKDLPHAKRHDYVVAVIDDNQPFLNGLAAAHVSPSPEKRSTCLA